jgi:hypothetical protein
MDLTMQQLKEKDGGDGIKRPLDALLHADERTRDALPIGSLRNGLNQRGRHTSMYSFIESKLNSSKKNKTDHLPTQGCDFSAPGFNGSRLYQPTQSLPPDPHKSPIQTSLNF